MIVSSLSIIFLGVISFTSGDKHHHIGPSRGDHSGWSHYQPAPSYHPAPSHGSGLGSFFDIALTGLAFLSFGTFLLNLLMNALFGAGFVTGTILPTTTGTGIITMTGITTATGGITLRDGVKRKRTGKSGRGKRDTFDLTLDPVSSADSIAALVLKSIDAMAKEHECVQKVFCDGNKEARLVGHGFEYLMPAYSLGATYIGQKFGLHSNISNHINGIFHGMRQSNCQSQFPQC